MTPGREASLQAAYDALFYQLRLPADAPLSLEPLTADQAQRIATMFHGVRHSQREAIFAALEQALQHVPALLRGLLRKTMGG
jgi:hypothetical protein